MTRRPCLLAAVVVAALAAASPVLASSPGPAAPSASPAPAGASDAPSAPGGERWGDGRTTRGSQPTATPAKDGSYNLRQMALAAIVMALMGVFVVWLVRRHTRAAADQIK